MRSTHVLRAALALAGAVSGACIPAGPFPMPKCKGVDIEDLSIEILQSFMVAGKLTSRDLVSCYLARIEQTNEYLKSVSEVNPDALAIADAMDEERAAGHFRGPMHGIPFLVKDNYYTNDKHNTSEGTLVLLGGRYSSEATVVAKVRAAGGVLIGHSTMSEAADHRALSNYASGYSSRTGQGRNPYNFTQSTAGSSSGSVIAVRTNQVAIALGTETHGSLTHPSAQLGLYTIKSTPGLMSRHGVVTGSYYHDTPGPLARSMKDVSILLDIMVGADKYDNLTLTGVGSYPEKGYASKVVKKQALKGMKLGLPWFPYWASQGHINSPGTRAKYDKRIKELEAAGATIYNITTLSRYGTLLTYATKTRGFDSIASPYGGGNPTSIPSQFNQVTVFSTLMAVGYAEWLANWSFPEDDSRHGMSTIDEMAAWNDAHNDTTGALGNGTWWWDPKTGQSFYDAAVATKGEMGSAFWTAFGWGRMTAAQAIDSAHTYVAVDETTGETTAVALDGLLVPSGRGGGYGNACASVPAYAGYPVAQVPVDQDGFATPMGMCVYGQKFGEAKLVEVASAMEDLFQWNEKPMWHEYLTAKGPWLATWPGYTCSNSSLNAYSCSKA
ncbi:amidase signature domain-containing protein [Microdochium trichocladiopsis]|uniref:Amidase signature domain-containing protein n=1 Tax=Microdochium trichocladiopsis TaxID=1682393 RepID=A0A9P9BSY7_9PEZI|nr:amidase signature domain-containing protein [Microdochium trichocladiopsis]KAH7038380.1 amidase signature domain-containing protein [Microdochium trichocladiopsis]